MRGADNQRKVNPQERYARMSAATRLSCLLVLICPLLTYADLSEIKFNKEKKPPISRAIFNDKGRTPKKEISLLEKIRIAQSSGEFLKCADLAAQAEKKIAQIGPWLSINELDCLTKLKGKHEDASRLLTAIKKIEKEKDWLLFGPYSDFLRKALIDAKFMYLSWHSHLVPQEAWKFAEDLLNYQEWMTTNQKADAFRQAGELAFLRQKLSAAKRFIERSLEFRDDEKLKAKLNSIESVLKTGELASSPKVPESKAAKDEKLEASERELELYERMKIALRSGDIVSAVEDGMNLIEEFPWGTRAQWASERIFESYSNVSSKADPNYILLKSRIVKQMSRADGRRLSDWANQFFKLSQYADAFALSEQAIKKIGVSSPTSALILMTARAATFLGEDRDARKWFNELILKHAGTSEARSALFYLGLLEYRAKQYTASLADFERLLVLPQTDDLELETRYWLWRSLQKIDPARAEIEAKTLATEFPFTYYGLRAQSELNGGALELPNLKPNTPLSANFWVTEQERKSWERIQILLGGGWWVEAQKELEEFPHPKDPVVRAFLAQYWVSAFSYPRAIKLFAEGWDADARLQENPFFRNSFPMEFDGWITREAKKNSLDPNWVRSLIRQESAFNYTAKSRSGALGLMQMIPPTVQEVAQDLKYKNINLPDDMFNPEKNLIFCTYYLAKVLKSFGGNLPAALAAYNAGPTRIQKWLESRKIELAPTSDPEREIWIEELPWSETRFYVKAILRNLILYRSLAASSIKTNDQNYSRVLLSSPIWMAESVDTK